MTVLEATNKLIDFFAQNEHFEIEEDFKKVCLISDSDAHKASILIALEKMAEQGFVIKKDIAAHEYWILVKPLGMQSVSLTISLMTAANMAAVINKYIKNPDDKCNPLQLGEQDIINLLLISQKD